MTKEEIRHWLVQRIHQLRGLAPDAIDTRERFIRFGLDSLASTRMVADLGTALGRSFLPTLAWEHPTIESLATFLTDGAEQRAIPVVVSAEHASRVAYEPVAIIGMGCRFPGAANINAFWQLLQAGQDAIAEVPKDRWDVDALYADDPQAPGALSLEDAAAIICRRSRLLRKVSGKGAMALVELTLPDAEEALVGYEGRLSVAVSNGPRSTVIAGDPTALDQVLSNLESTGVFCRRIKVDVASHSPQMDPLREELLTALGTITPKETTIPMRSTVTGQQVRGPELTATYWADNLRQPVLFSRVVEHWIADGATIFVEMSPHPILVPSLEENLREANADGIALASTRRAQDEKRELLLTLGALHAHGVPIEWKRFFPQGGRVVDLPTYPWQRERYWVESPTKAMRMAVLERSEFPLLGAALSSSMQPDAQLWQQSMGVRMLPWLGEHRVQGEIVFPGAAYIECGFEAGAATLGWSSLLLEDIAFEHMMVMDDNEERELQVAILQGAARSSLQVASRAKDESSWTTHTRGFIRLAEDNSPPVLETPQQIANRLANSIDIATFYQRVRERGVEYGPSFEGLVELQSNDTEVLAKIRLPENVGDSGYVMHPALLDACLQAAASFSLASSNASTYVPVGIAKLHLYSRPPRELWVLVTKRNEADAVLPVCDMRIMDSLGRVFVDITGLRSQKIQQTVHNRTDTLADCVYEVAWRVAASLPEPKLPAGGRWIIFADQSGLVDVLRDRLLKLDQQCVLVRSGASYQRVHPALMQIDASKPEDYRRLIHEVIGDDGHCAGVVFLSSLDATPFEQTTLESVMADLVHASVSATHLVQAIVRNGGRNAPRLFLVTRGAQSVLPNDPVSVSQSPILGLGKTITIEHPEIECRRIDLSLQTNDHDADLLLRELGCEGREIRLQYVNKPGTSRDSFEVRSVTKMPRTNAA